MEEDLNTALGGILSGDLGGAEGRWEEINPMTVEFGERGYRCPQQVEGGIWEGSLEEEEE